MWRMSSRKGPFRIVLLDSRHRVWNLLAEVDVKILVRTGKEKEHRECTRSAL
jgi:hypothetical protein